MFEVLFIGFFEELFYSKYRGHSTKIFIEITNNANVLALSLKLKKVFNTYK